MLDQQRKLYKLRSMRFCEGVIVLAKKKRAKTSKKLRIKKKLVRKIKPKKKVARKAVAKFKRKAVKKLRKTAVKKKAVAKKLVKQTAKKPAKGSSAANLMVTYDPNHRALAEAEVTDAFKRIDDELKFLTSEIEGVFKIATSKPRESVKKLAKLCMKEPDLFKATYQYVPIDTWCASGVKEMQEIIKQLEEGIKTSEKWKMTLNKRSYEMPAMDLIIKLTDVVNRPKVDLKNPEKIIRVEIFGDKAGIALLKADEAFSVPKLKEPE